MNSEAALLKTFFLNNVSSSYLLLVAKKYIITNTNYKEFLLLDHDMCLIRTIPLPEENLVSHYEYKNETGEFFLLLENEGDAFMLLDLRHLDVRLIKSDLFQTLSISSAYTWHKDNFFVRARCRDSQVPILLHIDTANLTVGLRSYESRYEVAPALAQYLVVCDSLIAQPIACNQRYMILSDFERLPTITVIDSKGNVVKIVSIETELAVEMKQQVNNAFYVDIFPHTIDYQDNWLIFIWETKILLVGPQDERTILFNKSLNRIFFRAKFIETTGHSSTIVALTHDAGREQSKELQLYSVRARGI